MANGKPGPKSGSKKREFNVDDRKATRAKASVTINNKQFFPAPETTAKRAAARKLSREQRAIRAEANEIGESTDVKDLDRTEELDADGERLMYEQVALELIDDQDNNVEAAYLQEHLPPEDVGPLYEFLAGDVDAKADADPS